MIWALGREAWFGGAKPENAFISVTGSCAIFVVYDLCSERGRYIVMGGDAHKAAIESENF